MTDHPIELLAPAKDLECGRAAIDAGADAVYLGAPRFGARENAGNSLEDIAALAAHAHKYWARVYVTLNTLLHEDELAQAVALARQLDQIGIDGLIVQDTGLLESALPPLPLIASTQMHNATPERVAFLEGVGFGRAILARELDLTQIRAIRQAAPKIELECFIHGALCVCYSGQCYLSYALGGRSGNRGACAQPCRKHYYLEDAQGRDLASGHLLSLRDLNQTENLRELLEAGVSSFKIEGRLKDQAYVTNVVAHYRAKLDELIAELGLRRASSGVSRADFTPDPAKTFNRGFTTYYLHGRGAAPGSPETPKMTGEALGRVEQISRRGFTLEAGAPPLHPGDGLCFFDRRGELRGALVNAVEGRWIIPHQLEGLEPGLLVRRNHDHEFLSRLKKARLERKIEVRFVLRPSAQGLTLTVRDESGVRAEAAIAGPFEAARNADQALANITRQIEKTGGTDFACAGVELDLAAGSEMPFVPVGALNALRREALEALAQAREAARPRPRGGALVNDLPYPARELSFEGNVLNSKAEAFYRRHGVQQIEPAAESGRTNLRSRRVMTTRYCLKHQLGLCPKDGAGAASARPAEPLTLVDNEDGHRLRLRFDCARCQMEIYLGEPA